MEDFSSAQNVFLISFSRENGRHLNYTLKTLRKLDHTFFKKISCHF